MKLMFSPNCHLRFSIFGLETLSFEWQCNQYLELNPTCTKALKVQNTKSLRDEQSHWLNTAISKNSLVIKNSWLNRHRWYPEFPRGGCANPWGGFANLLFGKILDKNCMKMKEIWPKGAGGGGTSLVPALDVVAGYFTLPVADLHGNFWGTPVYTKISLNFWQLFSNFSVAGLQIKILDVPPPTTFLHFHAVFGERLRPPLSGKSLIRRWTWCVTGCNAVNRTGAAQSCI